MKNKTGLIHLLVMIMLLNMFACTKRCNEWVEKNGNKYYYDEKGNMLKNCYSKIGIDTYAFDNDGALIKNSIVNHDEKLSFVDSDGKLKYYGWCLYNGNWYFANQSVLQTGWIKDQGNWYYFDNKAIMTTGWTVIDGEYYLFDNSGKMQTGWQENNKYYLDNNGVMLKNTSRNIDGVDYIFDSSGVASIITKEKKSNSSNYSNIQNGKTGTYAKYSILYPQINAILEPAYKTWNLYRQANDNYSKLQYSYTLESYGNRLCDICETAYSIDKASNNTKGQDEDMLFYRLGLTYIATTQ